MEKQVLVVVGKDVSVRLTEYQLSRLRWGCSSTSPNKDLVATGLSYCFLKEVNKEEGDVYYQSVEPEDGYDVCGNNTSADLYPDVRQRFVGPTKRLNHPQSRTVILKIPTYIFDKPFTYLHVVYDQSQVCFVTEEGRCLLVNRDTLCLPSTPPKRRLSPLPCQPKAPRYQE
jgi:hypothetical protein